MNYDLFISYSRKDFEEVKQFVDHLKECIPSLTYWLDLTDIETADVFEDRIISAIDNSSYVIFAISDNSIQSTWTKDEVSYAKNTGKKVIPVLLKGAQLKGWFLFKFGRVDSIDATDQQQVNKLLGNLSNWTGKELIDNKTKDLPKEESPSTVTTTTQPEIISAPKTYKVGDFYDDGKKRGVIFEVSADGTHGKIVSLKEANNLPWSYGFIAWWKKRETYSFFNGAENMAKIKQVANWQIKYPAFAWCAKLGKDWYLPAIEELKVLLSDKVYETVNFTLANRGMIKLAQKNSLKSYWSSTEREERAFLFMSCVWWINVRDGYTYYHTKDTDLHNVRAISAF